MPKTKNLFKTQAKSVTRVGNSILTRNKLTPKNAVLELAKVVCPNDTSNIPWWRTGTPGSNNLAHYEDVSDLCADNFLVYVVTDSSQVKNHVFDEVSLYNKSIRKWCTDHGIDVERGGGVKAKGLSPSNPDRTTPKRNKQWDIKHMREAIESYQRRHPLQPKEGYYLQHYKVATPNADFNKVHEALTEHNTWTS